MNKLATTIFKTQFKDEFVHLTDYIVSAFYGESEETICKQMIAIFNLMTFDMQQNNYVMISDAAASDERCELGEYLCNIEGENKTKSIMAFATITCFSPIGVDALNNINQNKLWEKTRRAVAKVIHKNMPNLKPKGLFELLGNEDATIDEQPSFTGLHIDSIRSLPFHKRITPINLRYDQQEQGNNWVDVLAGAIASHYHSFLEIKQDEYFRLSIVELTQKIKTNPNTSELGNVKQWMIDTYQNASRITE